MSPEIEKVYGQLLWIERRRQRILAAVSSHFGRAPLEKILPEEDLRPSPPIDPPFRTLVDERGALPTLKTLSEAVLRREARTVKLLRAHVSVYRHHVDEQILFGVRTAGQEAGRDFMGQSHQANLKPERLDIPEAIQAVMELHFQGLPGEKNQFLSLRAHGGSTVHAMRSASLDAWRAEDSDPEFLHLIQLEWVRGILDILSPGTEYSVSSALEKGDAFGLAQFHQRGTHAGP
ncbi:MAG: hypothetical protein EOP11_26655 [Proteobacteria bacterium]|nr:MAG: hypothetical protein EOP11_26655 [Pseudomonadota bacterium]